VKACVPLALLLLSSCSVTKMNIALDLRGSTLVFDSSDAYPVFDVVSLTYPGHGTAGAVATAYGAPVVPELGFQVVLPQYVRVKSVTGVAADAETIPGSFRLMPLQRPIPSLRRPASQETVALPEFVPPLPEIYGSATPYPPRLFAYVPRGTPHGDFNVADIVAYPVRYIPREGKLTF